MHKRFFLNYLTLVLAAILVFFVFPTQGLAQSDENPALPGFNLEDSDAEAIEIADQVMKSMGGRKNWDNTRYVTWRFFGRRLHVWDKWTGNIRFESGERTTLMNIHTKKGRVWQTGEEVTAPDSLAKYLDRGHAAWINDSYWVFMPYKLKDSGVTLKHKGEGKLENGKPAYHLELTFKDVGRTPQNKYDVYVDKESLLVAAWSFYRNASDEKPSWTMPWQNWKKHGNILLSDDRGRRKHSDIAVFDELPESVFENPAQVDMMSFVKE
jgi:hypothetical protein